MRLVVEMELPEKGRREAGVVLTLIAQDVVDSPFAGGHVTAGDRPVARWTLLDGAIDWEAPPALSGPGVPHETHDRARHA